MSKGLTETASTLHREANLDSSAIMKPVCTYQPFTYRSPVTTGVSFIFIKIEQLLFLNSLDRYDSMKAYLKFKYIFFLFRQEMDSLLALQ